MFMMQNYTAGGELRLFIPKPLILYMKEQRYKSFGKKGLFPGFGEKSVYLHIDRKQSSCCCSIDWLLVKMKKGLLFI